MIAEPQTIEEVLRSVEARRFWEQVYISALEQGRKDANDQIPWSGRAAEIADQALSRWKERFLVSHE